MATIHPTSHSGTSLAEAQDRPIDLDGRAGLTVEMGVEGHFSGRLALADC